MKKTLPVVGGLFIAVAATAAANQPVTYLSVQSAGASGTIQCNTPSADDRKAAADAITKLVEFKLGIASVSTPPPGVDVLRPFLHSPSPLPLNVVIATYCKTGDVYNVSLTGYGFRPTPPPTPKPAPPPPRTQVGPTPTPSPTPTPYLLTSSSLSGTFDA